MKQSSSELGRITTLVLKMSNSDLQFHVVQDHHDHDAAAGNQIHDHDPDHQFDISRQQLLKFPDCLYDDDHDDDSPATPSDQDDHEAHQRDDKDDDDEYQQGRTKEEEEEEYCHLNSTSTTGRALILVDPDQEEHPTSRTTSSSPLRDQLLLSDDMMKVNDELDEDGFKTPTSLEHKIPVMKECPLAPRKAKASAKRKGSSTTSPHLDFCQQLHSMFPPISSSSSSSSLNNIPDLHPNIKKTRTS